MSKRLVIIEDEYTIALDIEVQLTQLGYTIVGMGESFEDAIQLVSVHDPDLVLMDIRIDGEKTGIDAAKIIQKSFDIPVVFLTSHADSTTFETALDIKPYGYVLKPFNAVDLKNAIEVALVNHKAFQQQQLELLLLKQNSPKIEIGSLEKDALFVRENGQLTRISIHSILRLQAMDNYTLLYTTAKKHIVSQFLKDVCSKLPPNNFMRVHRSHVVNINKIDSIDGNLLFIEKEGVPISKSYRTTLMERLEVI